MFRSLHMKLTLILLLLISSLMAVVGAFLTTSVSSFYIDTFYQQIDSVFGQEREDTVSSLRRAAESGSVELLRDMLDANADRQPHPPQTGKTSTTIESRPLYASADAPKRSTYLRYRQKRSQIP